MDDSELDIREIVPRVGETAETEKFIGPVRARREGEALLEMELSDEVALMAVLWFALGLSLSARGERCCMLQPRIDVGASNVAKTASEVFLYTGERS